MSDQRGLIIIFPEYEMGVYEEMWKLPPNDRTAFLHQKVSEGKGEILGYTDKSAPELATELIKKGIKTRSYTIKETPLE